MAVLIRWTQAIRSPDDLVLTIALLHMSFVSVDMTFMIYHGLVQIVSVQVIMSKHECFRYFLSFIEQLHNAYE